MDIKDSHAQGGSLQISSDVIEKIARLAALEVDGVADVSAAGVPMGKSFLDKIAPQKAIHVEPKDDVADIEICIVVDYGTKIPDVSTRVQENIKQSVQNMTSIIVGRVNIVATGVKPAAAADAPEGEE